MSKRNIPLEFMLGMTHEEFEHWVWCGEHSEDNVVELHKEALRLREEAEQWKKLADAKVVFASNGNNEYQYELQEENMRLRKELEEARKISFPRQPDGKYGWTIDFSLLRKIQQLKSEYPCNSTLEEIESVLLVLETFWGQEGEGNQ